MTKDDRRAPAQTLEFDQVVIERFPVGKHRANAYLAYHAPSRHAVVIDPGAEDGVLTARIAELTLAVRAILLTHGHWDHVGAADRVAAATGAPVYIHPADRALLKAAPIYAFRIDGVRVVAPSRVVTLDQQPVLALDDAHPVSVAHVPGHTAGGVTFRLGRALFTGDTLLPGEAGRFDLPGGDAAQLQQSLLALRSDLQPHDMVCPGHGPCWRSHDAIEWLSRAAVR